MTYVPAVHAVPVSAFGSSGAPKFTRGLTRGALSYMYLFHHVFLHARHVSSFVRAILLNSCAIYIYFRARHTSFFVRAIPLPSCAHHNPSCMRATHSPSCAPYLFLHAHHTTSFMLCHTSSFVRAMFLPSARTLVE